MEKLLFEHLLRIRTENKLINTSGYFYSRLDQFLCNKLINMLYEFWEKDEIKGVIQIPEYPESNEIYFIISIKLKKEESYYGRSSGPFVKIGRLGCYNITDFLNRICIGQFGIVFTNGMKILI